MMNKFSFFILSLAFLIVIYQTIDSSKNYAFSVQQDSTKIQGIINLKGGTIQLKGTALIKFPPKSFISNTKIIVSKTNDFETQKDFDLTTKIFTIGPRLPYEIRINSGKNKIFTDFVVEVNVPKSFLLLLPLNAELQTFVQIWEEGGKETLDSFELYESTFDPTRKIIKVTLPKEAFTNNRTADGSYEAVIVLGTTLTKPNN